MKRKAGLAMLLLLLISAIGMITQAKTLTAAEKAQLKYAQYLNSRSTEGTDGYVEYFASVLLDDNAVPDLFEMTDKVASVSFLNGQAYKGTERTWADMTVVYYIYPKTGVFSYNVYDSDGSTMAEFLYRRLVVRTNGKKDIYVASMVRNDEDEDKYYNGSKENTAALITKADYTDLVKEYAGSVSPKRIAFYKNTAANRKKYLGDTGEIASIVLSPTAKTLALKETAVLTAAVKSTDSSVVSWVSDNPKVVSVEPDPENENSAVVTARRGGIARITASVSGVTATCTVTVDAPSVELDQTSASLFPKKTLQLKAAVTGPSKTAVWNSSDPAVASVSASGLVTAKKAGKTTITASANGLSASCAVTVRPMEENVSKLTAVKAGKTYIIRFRESADPVVVTRKGSKLYIDDKAVLTLRSSYPAYAIYLTDLDTDDSTKEVLELVRNSSGQSAMNVYRYASGKLTKAAAITGKKGSSISSGFSYKSGQSVKTPGDGTIVMQQNLLLGGNEKVTVQMKYELNGKKIQVIRYEDDSETLLSAKTTKNKLRKALTLVKKAGGTATVAKYKKGTSYKPMKLAVMKKKVFLRVTIKGKKGWFGFPLSKVTYQ